MFRVKDHETGEAIISIDVPPEQIAVVAERGRRDLLRCPECHHPCSFKPGQVICPHFSHKPGAKCPSANDTLDVLLGRLALYRWLQGKIGKGIKSVQVEWRDEERKLPRPLDCWAQSASGHQYGYWIATKRLSYEDWGAIHDVCRRRGISLVWVLTAARLERNDHVRDIIHLTPTARNLLMSTAWDLMYLVPGRPLQGSLHYLDGKAGTLTTFRALGHLHGPGSYQGHEITSPLEQVLLAPHDGQFVHPGEHDHYQAYQAQRTPVPRPPSEPRPAVDPPAAPVAPTAPRFDVAAWLAAAPAELDSGIRSGKKTGTCAYCGRVTSDWIWRNGATGQCVCQSCHRAGQPYPPRAPLP